MEDITDVDYAQAKRVCRDFEIKYLGEYHDFYVQNDSKQYYWEMYLRTLDKGKTRIEEEFFLKITCFIFILEVKKYCLLIEDR